MDFENINRELSSHILDEGSMSALLDEQTEQPIMGTGQNRQTDRVSGSLLLSRLSLSSQSSKHVYNPMPCRCGEGSQGRRFHLTS